jgi:hypothetical protein
MHHEYISFFLYQKNFQHLIAAPDNFWGRDSLSVTGERS